MVKDGILIRRVLNGATMSSYILAVDDEPEIIQLFEATLRPLGFRLVSASDGDEALALVEREQPALILLDLMMPRMSGFHVLSALNSNPATAHIPIVVISAYAHEKDAEHMPGVVRVLPKGSFGAPELREVVSATLS
jgi:CheY-like chemotaxis protein